MSDTIELAKVIAPIVTFGLGLLASPLLEHWRDEKAEQRDIRRAERERRAEAAAQARAFERETLLQLQDAFQRHLRICVRMHFRALEYDRRGGDPKDYNDPPEIEAEWLESGHALNRLRARVGNEDVRAALDAANACLTDANQYGIHGRDGAYIEKAFADASVLADGAIDAVGNRIRELVYGVAPSPIDD